MTTAIAYTVRFAKILPGGDEYRCKVIAYNEHEAIVDAERKLEKSGLNRRSYGAATAEPTRPNGRTARANRQPRRAACTANTSPGSTGNASPSTCGGTGPWPNSPGKSAAMKPPLKNRA
jgi:hypothetical protein